MKRKLIIYISLFYIVYGSFSCSIFKIKQTWQIDTIGTTTDVEVLDNYAYVSAETSGLQIIDISDPTSPLLIGSYNAQGCVWRVQVSNKYAYIAVGDSSIQIVDISDPKMPIIQGEYITLKDSYNYPPYDPIYGFHIYDEYMCITAGYSLYIIDISIPSTPLIVGQTDLSGGYFSDVFSTDRYAYCCGPYEGLWIIDISDPSNPYFAAHCDDRVNWEERIYITDNYAYVASGGSPAKLQIIDISDPINSYEVAVYEQLESYGCNDINISGGYAYVADGNSGLKVIDISNPTNPVPIETFNTIGSASGVYISGGYAYIADGVEGLAIIKIE